MYLATQQHGVGYFGALYGGYTVEIHINAGNGLDNKETMERWADGEVRRSLDRFSNDVRRVEVHFSDNNGTKGGADDKRCTVEALVAQSAPVAVTHDAASLAEALSGANAKMVRALDKQIGKRRDVRDHTSIRKDAEVVLPEEN